MVHIFNLSTEEAEAGFCLWVPDQPAQPREFENNQDYVERDTDSKNEQNFLAGQLYSTTHKWPQMLLRTLQLVMSWRRGLSIFSSSAIFNLKTSVFFFIKILIYWCVCGHVCGHVCVRVRACACVCVTLVEDWGQLGGVSFLHPPCSGVWTWVIGQQTPLPTERSHRSWPLLLREVNLCKEFSLI